MSQNNPSNTNQNQIVPVLDSNPSGSNAPSQNQNVLQPRQPENMQGLLRFAMEATKNEDALTSTFEQLDPEKKKFLEEALKSLTINVIEVLLASIKKLKSVNNLSVESDVTEYNEAFETILEYIDRIDTANDFYKIGGFVIFPPCFNSVHASIRASACDLLAELCQNNPFCQSKALEEHYMETLLELLDRDVDERVMIKSLYAISCLTRDYSPGFQEFKRLNGLSVLMRALSKPIDKVRTKISFLLSALCESDPIIKDDLVNLGYLQLFIPLLTEDRRDSHEHILSVLLCLIRNHELAIKECRKPEYGFKSILDNHLKRIIGNEAANEERSYCESLLSLLFNNETVSVER